MSIRRSFRVLIGRFEARIESANAVQRREAGARKDSAAPSESEAREPDARVGQRGDAGPVENEHFVREQVADRQRKQEAAQEAANEARKLMPDERRQKHLHKMCDTRETGPGAIAVLPSSGVAPTEKNVFAAVYRVLDLNHPALKYKVETKARHVDDGVIVIHKYCNVVVVDNGAFAQQVFEPRVQKHLMLTGAKQHKRFKRLKLHHIKRPSYTKICT